MKQYHQIPFHVPLIFLKSQGPNCCFQTFPLKIVNITVVPLLSILCRIYMQNTSLKEYLICFYVWGWNYSAEYPYVWFCFVITFLVLILYSFIFSGIYSGWIIVKLVGLTLKLEFIYGCYSIVLNVWSEIKTQKYICYFVGMVC